MQWRWNHPEITLTLACGKTFSHETGLWCQKGWGPLSFGGPWLSQVLGVA